MIEMDWSSQSDKITYGKIELRHYMTFKLWPISSVIELGLVFSHQVTSYKFSLKSVELKLLKLSNSSYFCI